MFDFVWSDEYEIDGGPIDEEHRILIKLANDVFEVENPAGSRHEITELTQALFNYTKKHFEHEEEFMRHVNYPGLSAHAERHHEIVQEMTNALRTIHCLDDYLTQLRHLMLDWVMRHIAEEDHKIGVYLAHHSATAV